jgi:hypothetical protein
VVRIQSEDFDSGEEVANLRRDNPSIGAIASFIGLVRDVNSGDRVSELTLEHYPGMTEKALNKIVDEAIAEAMNITATDFPPEDSEPAIANLRLAASTLVKPPRLADAPAAFECRRCVGLAFGPQRELLIGEVLGVHVREGIVDPATLNVDFAALRPVGRLCGNAYARQRDMFELKRITYAEWRAKRSKP